MVWEVYRRKRKNERVRRERRLNRARALVWGFGPFEVRGGSNFTKWDERENVEIFAPGQFIRFEL